MPSPGTHCWLRFVDVAGEVLIQDRGRPDGWRFGVGRAGHADRAAAALAHRVVGNNGDEALFEIVGTTTIRLELGGAWLAAIGGAEPVKIRRGARAFEQAAACAWSAQAGDELTIEPSQQTYRRYLAVRGGLDVPTVLGSRAYDTLAQIGPPPVRPGDRLTVGPARAAPPWPITEPVPLLLPPSDGASIRVSPGPHANLAAPLSTLPGLLVTLADAMCDATWRVAGGSRAGVRLVPVSRLDAAPATSGVLASFPVFPGCLQLTPALLGLALGVDAPLTGGYPVPLVIDDHDRDQLARCRLGDVVHFTLH